MGNIVQQNHVLLAHSSVLCTVLAVACPILALEQQQQQIYSANTATTKNYNIEILYDKLTLKCYFGN